ncbi:hypothetical protein [Paraburkholderia fynbosensis]|uniref:Uncharacterized protein n=1 Tax=Paraburkholderia fynbosensis TaxID=1200993 RepID=A0A6J5G8N7_9BURK|nr:hypothetical protein [Paraburkholderia fynbosensis]CAB3795567.1 hypothetical protein LMG27177_03873 [Paraburkholderia fynbosensis]
MHVDDVHTIEDYSPQTLRELIGRVEKSRTFEQMIYRESELDEVWRLLDSDILTTERKGSNVPELENLVALRKMIVEAHDFIGNDSNTVDARDRLLKAVELV